MGVRKYPKYLEKGIHFGRWTVIEADENNKLGKSRGVDNAS